MRRIFSAFLTVSFLAASTSGAARASDFCAARTPAALPDELVRLAADPAMRIAVPNQGGIGNGGVCWWHSRFQRAAWYLARFAPTMPRPTAREARALIRRIAARNEVVEIPGFSDLRRFTSAYRAELQKELNTWQIRDGLLNQAYLRGLSGHARFRDADRMKARMDAVYAAVVDARPKGDVVWLMLQMRGIVSHASLVSTMSAEADGGYVLAVVDSNHPGRLVHYRYRPGDLELAPWDFEMHDYENVPYVGFSRDLKRIHRAIEAYCSPAESVNR